jgi:hypothetical protein
MRLKMGRSTEDVLGMIAACSFGIGLSLNNWANRREAASASSFFGPAQAETRKTILQAEILSVGLHRTVKRAQPKMRCLGQKLVRSWHRCESKKPPPLQILGEDSQPDHLHQRLSMMVGRLCLFCSNNWRKLSFCDFEEHPDCGTH